MKKWMSALLAATLLVLQAPLALAGHTDGTSVEWKAKPDKGKPDKPKEKTGKAEGRVSAVHAETGTLTLQSKGKQLDLLITDATKLEISSWKNVALSDIWAGDKVKAEYVITAEGNVAKKLKVTKQKATAKGTISAMDLEAATVTVAGKTVLVTEKTTIRSGKERFTLEDLVEGDQVSVSGYRKEDAVWAASIEVSRKDTVVKGTIASIDTTAATIKVGETTIVVAGSTKLRINGKEASLAELAAGDRIVATGKKGKEGFVAKVISVHREVMELEGAIDTLDAAAQTFTIAGTTIKVTESTELKQGDEELLFADLTAGTLVEVKAMRLGESWLALKVKVEDDEDDDDEDDGDDKDDDEDDEDDKDHDD